MPAKNSLKTYIDNGFYHIYNRGVEKRNIFLDEQDYCIFLSYLKLYLSPKEKSIHNVKNNIDFDYEDKNKIISQIYTLNNFFNLIDLICFVLMPNHFHLELKQTNKKDIEIFMRSLITKYTMYFNRKYKRVGPLFQGRYKAVLIKSKEYLLHLSQYIHNNPLEIINKDQQLSVYPWSSYPAYVYNYSVKWIKKEYIFDYFNKSQKPQFKLYKDFVESYSKKSKEEEKAYENLLLDLGQSL